MHGDGTFPKVSQNYKSIKLNQLKPSLTSEEDRNFVQAFANAATT
jgi:hypothetical protein